jgi:hypothetical protein
LFGEAGRGKSTVVEKITEGREVLMSVTGRFFFGNYEASRLSFILFEEWEYDTYKVNLCQIKRLLEGKYFTVNIKYGAPRCLNVIYIFFFFPMPPHVLMNFRGFPPGYGDSVADF